jgi:hypothetical protein
LVRLNVGKIVLRLLDKPAFGAAAKNLGQSHIEPFGLSITDAAAAVGVTRTTLSEPVNEKRGISPEMAWFSLSNVCPRSALRTGQIR